MNRGFTVVEILVTLVVMAILLSLGTVGLRASLANGRDAERKADIEAIAQALETRYNKSYTSTWQEDTNSDGVPETLTSTYRAGSYPGNNELWDSIWWSQRSRASDLFPGITDAALKSPAGARLGALCFFYFWNADCDAAEKVSNIQGSFTNGSGGWKDMYLYEFIGPNGGYCNVDECTRYNLYWLSETKTTNIPSMGIPGLQVWRSKHQ